MSVLVKRWLLLAVALFLSLNVSANATKAKSLIATELNKISELANKKELTVKEWTNYVEVVDTKCDIEKDSTIKKAYCEFYYEIYKASELFTDFPGGPGRDDCDRYLFSAENMTKNKTLKTDLRKIVEKLCAK